MNKILIIFISISLLPVTLTGSNNFSKFKDGDPGPKTNRFSATKTSLKAVKVSTPPKIDGRLDEDIWQQVEFVDEFFQRQPNTGDPVSEKTIVYVCYSDKEIYFGFRCYDDPKRITAKELKRDISLGNDDRVQVIIDTFQDGRNGFWFQIGPRGSIGDALVSENGAAFNKQWDGLFEGKAHIHDEGWDAEIAIPFKTLRFHPDQTEWGLKLIRNIMRNQEKAYWPVANLDSYTFQISDAGTLTGLEGMSQGLGLDIRPYGLIGVNGLHGEKSELIANIGGDIFYQVSPGLSAALTINTDFAQTEVDSRQVNLTRFNLFFPEKRGFFLDGANYFNYGFNGDDRNRSGRRMIPFFSRNIGLDEDRNPIPVIGGLKIAGQAGKWSIGALNITDKPDNEDPRNFTVARVTRLVGEQSYVGFIGTKGNATGAPGNWLTGLDTRIATSKFQSDNNLALTAFATKSHTDSLEGKDYSYGADISYPNDFIEVRLGHQVIAENFRAGIGFVPRIGIKETYGRFSIGPRPNNWGIMKITSGISGNYITDMKFNLLTREWRFEPVEIEFLSGEQTEFAISDTYEYLDESFNIYEKGEKIITIDSGEYNFTGYSLELSSAKRRNLWAALEFSWGSFFDGSRQDYVFQIGWKIGIPFFLGMEYEQNNVDLPDGDCITKVYRMNGDIYFSPDISLSNFIQYDNLSEDWGWQSRLRWILKPGNELLFVWNSIANQYLERDRFVIAENTVRFKVNYNFRF